MSKQVFGTAGKTPPIEISGNTLVKTLKEQFKANFALTLRVFKLDGTPADDNQTIAEIRAGAKATDATVHMRDTSKVQSVPVFFKREIGIMVDVFSADDTELPNQNVTLKAAAEGKFDEKPKSVNVSGEVDTDNIEAFEDDNGKYGFRDKTTGRVVIEAKFDYAEDFGEDGTAYVESDDFGEDSWNWIGINGNIIERVYVYEYDDDGYAKAKFEGKYGIVDQEENEIIPFKYEDLGYRRGEEQDYFCYGGYIRVKLNGKWGMLDIKGNEIFPCIYDFIGNIDFESHDFKIKLAGKWGYGCLLDDKPCLTIPCMYDSFEMGYNSPHKVELDGEEFQINSNNERV